jgi:hypothetical protein
VSRLSEEVLVFGRLAAFGIIVGVAYWFISYEPAGTVMLVGFGAANAVATVAMWAASRHLPRAGDATDARPFAIEPGRIPAPAFAPFHVGAGLGVIALGLAFGPLVVLTGVVIFVIGARYWLEAAMREADASSSASATEPDRKGGASARQ